MANMDPSACLKVNRDTVYIPDSYGGVYFRNNSNSFKMEGGSIDQWIEKLFPMFNGKYSLRELTEGLPDPYRNRVYEIVEILSRNGFARDVRQDRPHQLPAGVLEKYASQIELLDSFGGSGAYRFQTYRQASVLAVGSGPFFVSLVAALFESGLTKFHMLITDSEPTNRERLAELEVYARETDPEAAVKEIALKKEGMDSWREAIRLFDAVLYVSQDVEELRLLDAVCRDNKKMFIPAIFVRQAGLAGPIVHPDSEGCWESAWRRLHRSALDKDPQQHAFSSTAGAMLANVIVFEWFKTVTGVNESERQNRLFLLDLETLEGNWHSFMPHPLVSAPAAPEWVYDSESLVERSAARSGSNGLLPYFGGLTSAVSGIFHVWEEGDLRQLPLAECRVQAVDPLSEGPAELLPEIICSDLTHEMARRQAGLAGIEAYVSRRAAPFMPELSSLRDDEGSVDGQHVFVGVGAGETVAEGISRGLQKCLFQEMKKQLANRMPFVCRMRLDLVEDERCRFYLQALTTIQGEPEIGWGEEVLGLPVVWIGSGIHWYGSIGLNTTLALRNALQQLLQNVQNQSDSLQTQAVEVASVRMAAKEPISLVIPVCEETALPEALQSAAQVLKRSSKRIMVFDLASESFLKEGFAGVVGVLLREGEYG